MENKLREYAQMVMNGDYDKILRVRFVGKKRDGDIAGYLSGVKKSIALLLYAAEKKDRVKLSEATSELYISRSSAHKLLQRRLEKLGLVEVDKRGKRMVYRLTPEGERVVNELVQMLEKFRPLVEEEKRRRKLEEERRRELQKRMEILMQRLKEKPDVIVEYREE